MYIGANWMKGGRKDDRWSLIGRQVCAADRSSMALAVMDASPGCMPIAPRFFFYSARTHP
jgi:hypothetical protein